MPLHWSHNWNDIFKCPRASNDTDSERGVIMLLPLIINCPLVSILCCGFRY